jgi:hypothetical protein
MEELSLLFYLHMRIYSSLNEHEQFGLVAVAAEFGELYRI